MNVKENRSLPTKSNIGVYSRGQQIKKVPRFFFMVLVQMEILAFRRVKKNDLDSNKEGNRNKSNGGETALLIVLR